MQCNRSLSCQRRGYTSTLHNTPVCTCFCRPLKAKQHFHITAVFGNSYYKLPRKFPLNCIFYYYLRSFAWQTLNTRFIGVDIHCTPNLHYHFRVSQGTHFPPCFLWQVLNSNSHDFYTSLRSWSLHFCRSPGDAWYKYPSATSWLSVRKLISNNSTCWGLTTGLSEILLVKFQVTLK